MFKNRLAPITTLSATFQKACRKAIEAQKHSYCPYSNFMVGACLVHKDGALTEGANYENSILQSTCAERTAIVSANVKGYRQAVAIAVYGRPANPEAKLPADHLCPPCGLCRQFLVEVAQLSGVEFEVVLISFDQTQAAVVTLSELLTCQFGPQDLDIDLKKWSNGSCDVKVQ